METVKEYFTISQVAKYLGVSTSHIRDLEKKKYIQEPKRNAAGVRIYPKADVEKWKREGIAGSTKIPPGSTTVTVMAGAETVVEKTEPAAVPDEQYFRSSNAVTRRADEIKILQLELEEKRVRRQLEEFDRDGGSAVPGGYVQTLAEQNAILLKAIVEGQKSSISDSLNLAKTFIELGRGSSTEGVLTGKLVDIVLNKLGDEGEGLTSTGGIMDFISSLLSKLMAQSRGPGNGPVDSSGGGSPPPPGPLDSETEMSEDDLLTIIFSLFDQAYKAQSAGLSPEEALQVLAAIFDLQNIPGPILKALKSKMVLQNLARMNHPECYAAMKNEESKSWYDEFVRKILGLAEGDGSETVAEVGE